MFRNEFIRLFSRKTLFILCVLLILTAASFAQSRSTYKEFQQMQESQSEDLNQETVAKVLSERKTLSYMFDFVYSSEFYQLFVMVFFAYIGLELSSESLKRQTSGFGNFVVSRRRYDKTFRALLLAQSFYIIVLLLLHFALSFFIAFVLNGFDMGVASLQRKEFVFLPAFFFLMIQLCILIGLSVLVNIICASLSYKIKNKYVIQILPLVGFVLTPIFLAGTLGNVLPIVSDFLSALVPFEFLWFPRKYLSDTFKWSQLIVQLITCFFLLSLAIKVFYSNLRELNRRYL